VTNGNSFGGGRNILLPIIFLLVTYVFLQILHIKISFLIWLVLLIVISFISLLLSIRSRLSLTSRLPSLKTIVIVLGILILVSALIFWAVYQVPKSVNYGENRTQEGFSDNEYHKDYVYYFDQGVGQVSLEEEVLLVFGTVSIINTDVFYPNPKLGFDILVAEGETAFIEVIFRDVEITTETSFNFTVGHHRRFQEVRWWIDDQSRIWVEVNGGKPGSLQTSPCFSFNSSKPFNVIVIVTGGGMDDQCKVNIDNVGLGA